MWNLFFRRHEPVTPDGSRDGKAIIGHTQDALAETTFDARLRSINLEITKIQNGEIRPRSVVLGRSGAFSIARVDSDAEEAALLRKEADALMRRAQQIRDEAARKAEQSAGPMEAQAKQYLSRAKTLSTKH